ncbi:hypothetical protein [uncultured Nitratireductor sp.]|uniref:hypothetical protein n=1 Tax=uncultured Nitratireductor sp. TaxID=520953 RepID=UPI0025D2ECBA|nr:hypothetical protein [uncultured Nitratireductor sp.]
MDVSILLARLIGPLYLAAGIGLLLNQGYYRDMLRNLRPGGMLYYISGAIALTFGVAVLQFHNLWVADWRVVLTLFGWLGLIKGIVLLVFPQAGARLSAQFAKSSLLLASAVFATLLGLWLCYLGYVA